MYGYNAEPPIAIPIYTVLPYCVILLSTAVVYPLSKVGNSLMRVGQPRLMPRAEKRFVCLFFYESLCNKCTKDIHT